MLIPIYFLGENTMKMIGALKFDADLSPEQSSKVEQEIQKMDGLIKNALKNQLDFTDTEEKLEPVACQRVDGFIPFSHNKGGYELSSLILGLSNAIESCTDQTGKDKMQKMVDEGYLSVAEDMFKEHKEELAKKGIESVTAFQNYMNENDEYDKEFNEKHDEYIDDEAVSYRLRVMFNGVENDEYHFTVDAQVNWEFPYFRDGKGCSAYKETEFSVKNSQELAEVLSGKIAEVKSLFK